MPGVKPAGDAGETVELLEESRATPSLGKRHDERDRRHAVTDRSESDVPRPADVHLSQLGDAADVTHVRREGDAPRRGGVHAPEPPRDDRSQAVGADHDACAICVPFPVSRFPCYHTGDRAGIVNELLDLHSLSHLDTSCLSCGAQNRVEARARQRKTEIREPADDTSAARRHDLHAGEPAR